MYLSLSHHWGHLSRGWGRGRRWDSCCISCLLHIRRRWWGRGDWGTKLGHRRTRGWRRGRGRTRRMFYGILLEMKLDAKGLIKAHLVQTSVPWAESGVVDGAAHVGKALDLGQTVDLI